MKEAPDERVADAIVIPAADAAFTDAGKGVSIENKKAKTEFDAEHELIINSAKDTEITYTAPEGAEGTFDIYLTVSKIMAQFTSQPFSFRISGGELFSVPIDCEVFAHSIAAYTNVGSEGNTGSRYDDAASRGRRAYRSSRARR